MKTTIILNYLETLFINNSNIKTPINSKGNIDFDIKIFESDKNFDLSSIINLNKFILLQEKFFPIIFLKNATINSNSMNQFLLNIDGTINSLDFNYNASLNFDFNLFPSWKINGTFTLLETNYQVLLDLFSDLYNYYIKDATKENAPKYEDLGPAWENKFSNSNFYKIYLRNISINNNIQFLNPKQKNIPELKGNFITNDKILTLSLNGDNQKSHIIIQYNIDYLQMVPFHNLFLLFDLKQPELEIPFLCKNCKKYINRTLFSYTSNFNGIYIADFYLNNTSNLKFEVDSIIIENDYRREMIEKLLSIDLANIPVQLKINYSSYGVIYTPIQIETENEKYILRGFGNYNIFNGGKLNFYFYNKETKLNRNFVIKIRKDGIWIPSYLY
ncbi:MAG: hypothetical protein KatS3mg068_2698 [Candidatus Sericytochromatia bacterium]|nr:MAG: hypothetical protein KatS3mg068_2698 [Candidatus Sericytochromatia bacterium]